MHDPRDPQDTFDLDRQIHLWREMMAGELGVGAADDAARSEVIDELESHLRDDVDELIRAGRSPAQAWEAALARLGDAVQLAAEFGKFPRVAWLPARAAEVVLALCAVLMAAFLAYRVGWSRTTVLLACHVFAVTVGYGAALAFGMTAVAATVVRSVGGFGPAQSDAFRRTGVRLALLAVVMTLLGILLGAIWAGANWGRAWAWDPRETGGLCVLGWSAVLLACLRWRAVGPTSAVLAGVVANIIVAVAWFVPPIIEARIPGSTRSISSWHAPLLAAFAASQLACLYACLLPAGWLSQRRPPRGTA